MAFSFRCPFPYSLWCHPGFKNYLVNSPSRAFPTIKTNTVFTSPTHEFIWHFSIFNAMCLENTVISTRSFTVQRDATLSRGEHIEISCHWEKMQTISKYYKNIQTKASLGKLISKTQTFQYSSKQMDQNQTRANEDALCNGQIPAWFSLYASSVTTASANS